MIYGCCTQPECLFTPGRATASWHTHDPFLARAYVQVQKAVEQREKDIAKWNAKTKGGDDEDSLESNPKPRKVPYNMATVGRRALTLADGEFVGWIYAGSTREAYSPGFESMLDPVE